jgi:hypothetical protein
LDQVSLTRIRDQVKATIITALPIPVIKPTFDLVRKKVPSLGSLGGYCPATVSYLAPSRDRDLGQSA